MKRNVAILAGLLGFLINSSAYADDCDTTVSQVTLSPEGDLIVKLDSLNSARMRICQLDTTVTVNRGSSYGGNTSITPGRCAGLLSAFLTAKSTGNTITVRMQGTCSFTDGAYPNPFPHQFVF